MYFSVLSFGLSVTVYLRLKVAYFWPKNWTKNLPKNLTKIWVFYISGKALVTAAFLQKSTVLSNRRQQNLDGQFSARFSNAIEPSLPLMTSGKNFRGLWALCSRNFQNVKLSLTLLKFDHFITTPILREIILWRIQMVQKRHFGQFQRLWTLNFW